MLSQEEQMNFIEETGLEQLLDQAGAKARYYSKHT